MNPTELKPHLMAFADGELPAELHAELTAALASSPELQAELAEIERVSLLARAATLAPADQADFSQLFENVMAQTAPAVAPAPGLWARFSAWCGEVVRFERPLALAGLGAAAVALIAAGTLLSRTAPGTTAAAPVTAKTGEPTSLPRRGAEGPEKAVERAGASVEHLEAKSGKAFIALDQDDPEAPMVLWHVPEDDTAPAPKGL